MQLNRSRLLPVAGSAFALILPFFASALEDRVVQHDASPPAIRTLHVKPIVAFGKRQGSNAALSSIGVSRSGDVFVLSSSEKLAIYDPIANALRDAPLEIPEGLRGQDVSFFSFDPDGGAHVCYQPPSGRPVTLVSFDLKGRVFRSRALSVTPVMASAAVAPSGDLFLSTLSPRGLAGGPEASVAPVAPVLVFDKDGALKGAVGTWDKVEGNAAEVALRNLRIVLATSDGNVALFRKDRYEFEIFDKNGARIRMVTVAAKDQRKPHLYDNTVKEKATTSPTTPPAATKDGSPLSVADTGDKASDGLAPTPTPPIRKGRTGTTLPVDIPSVIRGVALQGDWVYILRNPYAYGGKDPRPVVDVFDFFGRWEEQIQLDSRDRFDNIAVARDGTLYLTSAQSDHFLWMADLHEQPVVAPAAEAPRR